MTNPSSDVPTLDGLLIESQRELIAAQSATIQRLSAELETREDSLRRIEQWAEAYPLDIFPEPDLDAVKAALSAAGILNQMDRMHSSWARYIVSGIREITSAALTLPQTNYERSQND